MATQTTYAATIDDGRVGVPADTGHKVLISRTVETEAVGFGIPVAQGTEDYGVRPTDTGDVAADIIGVAAWDRSATDDSYAVGDTARIMTEGVIWVTPIATVAAGDPVHVVVADATFTNTGGVVVTGARYETSGAAASLVKIRL